jgi:O-antigen/teichoic acid export membrane protein
MSAEGQAEVPSWVHWNVYGWFGGLIAFAGQLLAPAVVLVPRAPLVAAIWFGCSGVIIAVACMFWRYRIRVRAYTALQSLILVWWVGMIVAYRALETLNPEITDIGGWQWNWSHVLMTPAVLMTVFALKERATRRGPRSAVNADPTVTSERPQS